METDYQRLLSTTPNVLGDHLTKAEYYGQRTHLRRHQISNDDYQPTLQSMRDLLTSGGVVLGDLHFKAGIASMLSLVVSSITPFKQLSIVNFNQSSEST